MVNPSIPNLNVPSSQAVDSVESYQFEPIKGYPMLNWKGKRPFTSTYYYPAQLRERYGESVNNWMSRVYWGDNLQVMSHLLKEFRGKVNLVYIDPPFDSKADYKKKISLRGQQVSNDLNSFEEKQYTDIWTNDEYLQFMYERLILIRELLADDGSIYLHCDYRKSHHLRCILDEIFGSDNFINEIVWVRTNSHNMRAKGFIRSNDNIIFYTKSQEFVFNEQFQPYSESQIKEYKPDEKGRFYTTRDLTFSTVNPNRQFEWRGTKPPANRSWGASYEQLEEWLKEGKIILRKDGTPRLRGLKVFLDETKGSPLTSNWDEIKRVGNTSNERLDYPTQKPEELLERIIQASSNERDIILDCFMGSGTTQAVAMKLGRRFIGADINLGAVQITTKRLLGIQQELTPKTQQTSLNLGLSPLENGKRSPLTPLNKGGINEGEISTYYTGFEVYNVNHYDVFRNPLEAKELLIEALELQKLGDSHLFDGEKDGRMYKIMPVNRIATKKDLNELIAGFDYKTFEKKQEDDPNKPVEKVTLVCMGHEPDLGLILKKEVLPYNIDVEVVDILRDRQDIQFKRDSEAKITLTPSPSPKGEGRMLVIENFYPMNLLGKLSLQQENVEDWRDLVESIMIDWNYDGAILEPSVIDIPDKKGLVKGSYEIPKDAGTIKVKITDLLSESLEIEVSYG